MVPYVSGMMMLMRSLRSRLVHTGIKFSKLLGEDTTLDTLAQKRANYERLHRFFPVSRLAKIQAFQGKGFKGEWIDAKNSRPDMVVLYFHGGGFVFGNPKVHRDMIYRIAKGSGARAFSVDYSLSPENPFPTPINEAIAAYRWLLKSYSPENIAFAGDSSGGSIVLSMLHVIREKKLPNPACTVVISPATDAHRIDEDAQSPQVRDYFIKHANINFFVESYFQKTPTNHPVASPLYGSLRGFPPLLIIVDKSELMYGQSARLAEKAKRQGVEVTFRESEGLWHVWPLFTRHIPEAKATIKEIAEFIRRNVA